MYIDSHTHLFASQFDKDRKEVFQKIFNKDVNRLIIPACFPEDVDKINTICNEYPDKCFSASGFHPTEFRNVKGINELEFNQRFDTLTEIANKLSLANTVNKVAVGEIGLDYHYDAMDAIDDYKHTIQREVFEIQLNNAANLDLPVILHVRDSWVDSLKILESHKENLKGVLHCFSGSKSQCEKILDLGLYIGIGGLVTYRSAPNLAELVANFIPLDRILLETDSPYITPVSDEIDRKSRNDSSNIPIIANKIAELKKIKLEEVAEITTENCKKLFNIN